MAKTRKRAKSKLVGRLDAPNMVHKVPLTLKDYRRRVREDFGDWADLVMIDGHEFAVVMIMGRADTISDAIQFADESRARSAFAAADQILDFEDRVLGRPDGLIEDERLVDLPVRRRPGA